MPKITFPYTRSCAPRRGGREHPQILLGAFKARGDHPKYYRDWFGRHGKQASHDYVAILSAVTYIELYRFIDRLAAISNLTVFLRYYESVRNSIVCILSIGRCQ